MRISRFAFLALVAPIALAAQQPGAPAPGTLPPNPITATMKGRIANLHRNIAQAFDSIPESKFSYKPTPAQLSIGFIAAHIANDDYFFCNNFGAMKGTRAAEDTATADSVKATWPKEKLVARLKESFAFCDQALNQLDDAKLAEPVTMTFGGNSRTVARAGMVIGHIQDMADHYSQLANYMRLNNMLPPTALPRPRPAGN
ncbi:MAG TPA: DinB family protein [Gemmatimonadaceae bacterium]|nr:DinB family protein [Gemmatimonadaceae bacterium]